MTKLELKLEINNIPIYEESPNILKFNRESIVFPTNSTKTTENP